MNRPALLRGLERFRLVRLRLRLRRCLRLRAPQRINVGLESHWHRYLRRHELRNGSLRQSLIVRFRPNRRRHGRGET